MPAFLEAAGGKDLNRVQLGSLHLKTVSGGSFRLDGGSMFGIVPRVLWSRKVPPDEQNRIPLTTNCVLVRGNGQTALIDTGLGMSLSDREKDYFAYDTPQALVRSLEAEGLQPSDITAVILSHLHFDHAGGTTRKDESGEWGPTFPNAEYIAQTTEWEIASSDQPEWRGIFHAHALKCLASSGQLRLVKGDGELIPGIWSICTPGHTPGHQSLLVQDGSDAGLYLGDLCPTWNHLRRNWCMAFDSHTVEVRKRKPVILGRCVDEGWWALSPHDPERAAARLDRHDKEEFVVVEACESL